MTIGQKMKVVTGELEGIIRSSFKMCAPHQILLGLSHQGTCEKRNAYTDWWGTVWHCYLEVHFLAKSHTATRTAANLPHSLATDIYGS